MLASLRGNSISSLVDLNLSGFSDEVFQANHGFFLIEASDKHETSYSLLLEVAYCKSTFLSAALRESESYSTMKTMRREQIQHNTKK
jgi:hypothetical protein